MIQGNRYSVIRLTTTSFSLTYNGDHHHDPAPAFHPVPSVPTHSGRCTRSRYGHISPSMPHHRPSRTSVLSAWAAHRWAAARPSGAALFNPSLLAADHSGWNDGFAMTLPSINARVAENDEVVDDIDRIQNTLDELQSAINGLDINPDSTDIKTSRTSPSSLQSSCAGSIRKPRAATWAPALYSPFHQSSSRSVCT